MKTKIEKLSKIETQNLDCKSPDFHEQFSTKSFDESKASVYFTPTDGHLSPLPLQDSPIHINYINDGITGIEAAGYNDWRAVAIRNSSRGHQNGTRNSFTLPCDYLDEGEESSQGNFIIPDPIYNDDAFNFSIERFQDVIDTPSSSMMAVGGPSMDHGARRRKKRYRDPRRSRHSIENETLLMQDMVHDVSKGARPKVYYGRRNHQEAIGKATKHFSKLSNFSPLDDDAPCCSSSICVVKKVNSQVDIDEKTGKVVSSSTSTDCDLAKNIDVNDKLLTQKMIKLQASSSLPDLQIGQTSSPSSTVSSNSNNQIQSHGKHVILAVEAQDMNQINDAVGGDGDATGKKKIKLNIDPASNGSSSSASSNNLEYGNGSNLSTL